MHCTMIFKTTFTLVTMSQRFDYYSSGLRRFNILRGGMVDGIIFSPTSDVWREYNGNTEGDLHTAKTHSGLSHDCTQANAKAGSTLFLYI